MVSGLTSSTTNNFEVYVKELLIEWLDSIFGPLYYVTFSIKLSKLQTDPPEYLLVRSPRSFYESIISIFESELLAKSFICTLLTYAKRLGINDMSKITCEEFIAWFKNNDVEDIKSFVISLIRLM